MDKYFRNTETIRTIDPDSLWKLETDKLVLVDEDSYFSLPYQKHKDEFYPVDPPGELK